EGLAIDGRLSPIQGAFLDHGGVQCGFCIPGQVLSAHALPKATPHPTLAEVEEGIAGNLCRCGCYEQITEAILAAAETIPVGATTRTGETVEPGMDGAAPRRA